MNISPELLAHLKSLERIDSADERRRQLLHFAEAHVSEEELRELGEIEDVDRLFKSVHELFTRSANAP